MTDIIVDIETDDLDATVIHVAVTQEIESGDQTVFTGENMRDLPAVLRSARTIYGHNAVAFDIPVINRLLGAGIDTAKVRDTMLISQLLWPDRPGGHSLRAWGERLGSAKIDFHDWSLGESAEMIEYCGQDVSLTGLVLRELQAEAARMDRRGGGENWKSALDTEHRVRAIMNDVEAAGYMLDMPTCSALVARLTTEIADIEADVLAEMIPLPKAKRSVIPKYKKDGKLSTVGLKHLGDHWECCGGDPTAIDWVVFNLGSRQQIGERLIREGWQPTRFTEQRQPIVDEGTLSGIDLPLARKISRYLMLQKRVSQITSWMDKVDTDNRVRCRYMTLGAITHRMSCNTPNLQQIPGPQSEYGAECRSCWTVPTGRQLIGTDLAGIELRCLAHYLNDQNYTEELIHGDVHTRTQQLAGLPDRASAKTFTYALLYSAGNARLGAIIGEGADAGAAMRSRFMAGMPSFAALHEAVSAAARSGFIRGIDNRVLRIRSEHAALNTLLQSCAAVVAKRWLIRMQDLLDQSGLDASIIAMIHDELCIEAAGSVDPSVIGEMSKTAVRQAEADLNFNCPLDCDWKVGKSWDETH